jgi:ribonuclease VapC
MIVVDASAILSVLLREPGFEAHRAAITDETTRLVSAASVLECSIRLFRLGGAVMERELDVFLDQFGLSCVDVDAAQLAAARDAFRRYGKGTGHPAALNFGDCFSYALAKTRDLPLLFKGADFAATDIRSALA